MTIIMVIELFFIQLFSYQYEDYVINRMIELH